MPASSCAVGAWAASSIGAPAKNAASAVPAIPRARLEKVTGEAPIRRVGAAFARAAEVGRRMDFLRRSRKNGPGGARHKTENPDVAVSWPELTAAYHIFG